MANTIGFGQAAVNNTIDYGQGAIDNTINWGKSQTLSPSGETNITGTGGTPPFSNTQSILLDGIDAFANCGNDSSLNLTSQITWSAWVKFNALNNAVNYGIVSNFDPNEGYKYTFIYYPSTTSRSRKLRLRINSSSGTILL
jgi:hypothetical protein